MGGVIGFAGLSHLGTVWSAAAAAKGFTVVGHDPDADTVAGLRQGRPPVHEPGLTELLRAHAGRLTFTTAPRALAGCSVVVLARDMPTDAEGRSDPAALDGLADAVAAELAPGAVLVVLSQVRPGATRALGQRLAPTLSSRAVALFYQVETLVFGRAVERALHPERFIVGCADPERPLPHAYREFLAAFGCPVLPMRYESAELAKIAANIFLTTTVTAANTLAEICERIGADWAEIVPALRLDARIGPHAYLSPGLGLAGGNLERDLAAVRDLAAEHGAEAHVVEACVADSRYRRDWALRALHAHLAPAGERPAVAVWGLAYKQDTRSTRNSAALALIESLPGAAVRAYDPQAAWAGPGGGADYRQEPTALAACAGADALVVMTPWPELAALDLEAVAAAMRSRLLIDPYGRLDGAGAARLGFSYFKLGVPGPQRRAA
jgi:UDPglucose 6-dehydrogenase